MKNIPKEILSIKIEDSTNHIPIKNVSEWIKRLKNWDTGYDIKENRLLGVRHEIDTLIKSQKIDIKQGIESVMNNIRIYVLKTTNQEVISNKNNNTVEVKNSKKRGAKKVYLNNQHLFDLGKIKSFKKNKKNKKQSDKS